MIGLYFPGTSLIHRMRPGWKLAVLALTVGFAFTLHRPWQVGAALLGLIALFAVARIPWRIGLAQLRPLLWVVPFIVIFQLIFATWEVALTSTGILLFNVGLASLLTLTTTVTDILNVCQALLRPFHRFGLDPDRVGLMLALTIRCIPLVAGIVTDVTQARKARGVTGIRGSTLALAAPAVIRALRTADALGEALRARGVDD